RVPNGGTMNRRSYARLAAFLFAIIAVLQFIRAVGGWEIVINGTVSVPVWASWVACIVFAGLALTGFGESSRKEEDLKQEQRKQKKQEKQERAEERRQERKEERKVGRSNSSA